MRMAVTDSTYAGQYPYKSNNGYTSEPERNYDSDYSIKYKTLDRRRNPSTGSTYEQYVHHIPSLFCVPYSSRWFVRVCMFRIPLGMHGMALDHIAYHVQNSPFDWRREMCIACTGTQCRRSPMKYSFRFLRVSCISRVLVRCVWQARYTASRNWIAAAAALGVRFTRTRITHSGNGWQLWNHTAH